jgi:hypothetical protein
MIELCFYPFPRPTHLSGLVVEPKQTSRMNPGVLADIVVEEEEETSPHHWQLRDSPNVGVVGSPGAMAARGGGARGAGRIGVEGISPRLLELVVGISDGHAPSGFQILKILG